MDTSATREEKTGRRGYGSIRRGRLLPGRPATAPKRLPPPALPEVRHVPRRRTLEVRSPADGKLLGTLPVMGRVQVLEAVERARSVQRSWIALESEERFERLGHLVEVLGAHTDRIADMIVDETGKPRVEALSEILGTAELLRYYAEAAPRVLRREWLPTGWMVGKSAYTYREPYGVVGVISPWTYPFLLVADTVVAALFTGNAVVIKPSERTPFSALKLRDLCLEAGLPPGLVDVVTGDGSTGHKLVEAGVDKVVFAGSSQVGRKVMATAARTLTPVALHLGGKDSAIVLRDADIERAARGIVYGAFCGAGQTCVSTERAFVVREVYDAFVERATELAGELRVGSEEEYDVGPLISEERLAVVQDQVDDAVARGARVTVGGERLGEGSLFYRPTVIADVDQSMKLVWEETYGPLLPIVRVRDEDEAVRLSNVNPYGLFASVWTEDRARGEQVAERLKAGGVSVNDVLSHYSVPGLPIAGVGESGFGHRRGIAGLEEVSRSRSVLVHRTGLSRELWWFPYSDRTVRLMRALLGYRQSSGFARIINWFKGLFMRVQG